MKRPLGMAFLEDLETRGDTGARHGGSSCYWKAEAGRLLVQGQPGLQSQTLSQNQLRGIEPPLVNLMFLQFLPDPVCAAPFVCASCLCV